MLAVERKGGMKPANANRTRYKQKAATLNYDGSFTILLKNIQKMY